MDVDPGSSNLDRIASRELPPYGFRREVPTFHALSLRGGVRRVSRLDRQGSCPRSSHLEHSLFRQDWQSHPLVDFDPHPVEASHARAKSPGRGNANLRHWQQHLFRLEEETSGAGQFPQELNRGVESGNPIIHSVLPSKGPTISGFQAEGRRESGLVLIEFQCCLRLSIGIQSFFTLHNHYPNPLIQINRTNFVHSHLSMVLTHGASSHQGPEPTLSKIQDSRMLTGTSLSTDAPYRLTSFNFPMMDRNR